MLLWIPVSQIVSIRCKKRSMDLSDYIMVIVDDDELNRTVLKLLISQLVNSPSFHSKPFFIEAENGYEAYQKISLFPDSKIIVFTDIHMPIMDGASLISRIQENLNSFKKGIKIIVNSSISECELRSKLNSYKSYNYFLPKPASLTDIKTALIATENNE